MTTVINYNVLNFFTMRLNNIAPGDDVRSYNRHPDDGRKTYPWEKDEAGDVIDVTPYSRTTVDDQTGEVRAGRTEKKIDLTGRAKIETMYNRAGKPVQVFYLKGLFVDTYV
jgi:hypothetical protein